MQNWTVYLSGEIHTDWRYRIAEGIEAAGLPVTLAGPVTDHDASDEKLNRSLKRSWGTR